MAVFHWNYLCHDPRWNSWTSIWQKDRVFSSMLFTVPSTGGFYRRPYSTFKIHTKKSVKRDNSSLFLKSIL
jgi:hypothetical protein